MISITYVISLLLLLAVCDNKYSKKYYIPAKILCSLCFVVIGVSFALKTADPIYSRWIMTALISCALGDYLMALYNQKKIKKYFMIGMGLFVFGHGAFIVALNWIDRSFSLINMLLPLGAVIIFFIIKKAAHIHMGRLTVFCGIYAFIVSAMMTKAITTTDYRVCAAAGISFFVSDFLIIFLYFYHFNNKKYKRYVHHLNLIFYYLAVYLFAISMC